MSLSKNELLYLMAYADGEVDDDELPEVEALIAKSEEARRVLAQQSALRQWALDAAESSAKRGRADGIADAVMTEIENLGGAKVITLERERAKRVLNQQRTKEFGALAAVAAVVALFYFWPSNEAPVPVADQSAKTIAQPPGSAKPQTPPTSPGAAGVTGQNPEPPAVAVAEPAEEPSIDVQAVESPQHPFSIFYVPGVAATGAAGASASSVVVWIGEE